MIIFALVSFEEPFFDRPYCSIIRDKNGELLSTEIASDYQWRFPPSLELPDKFVKSIISFEDSGFYGHIGVDPIAIIRATFLNLKHRSVISGGSTLTMQVIRLSRRGKPRTLFEKLIEAILAIKLELFNSKEEILNLYASYAPFGGNVVGLSAASWRYYNRESSDLSWAEVAALAVLPNSPGLIYPGRNSEPFLEKRNKLLNKLFQKGYISKEIKNLAILEPLPSKPKPLPDFARHLLNKSKNDGGLGADITTTLDLQLQKSVINTVNTHQRHLIEQGIYNSAVVVIDVESGNTLAYVGNSSVNKSLIHGNNVDIIQSKRSPGSLLKPILYSLAMDDGLTTPKGYLKDVPLYYRGFKPENYSFYFSGIVNADKALQKSLNIPFVNLLSDYGYTRFYDKLKILGLSFPYSSDHYGLTIILGGAECSLWDLTSVYGSMARSLVLYNSSGSLTTKTYHKNRYIKEDDVFTDVGYTNISPGSLYTTFNTMTKLIRPNTQGNWDSFSSSYPISWKTGTSSGFKDAWAIGFTKKYLVGVWVGNADGEGRAELVGVKSAGPILFDVFKLLPRSDLFTTPVSDMVSRIICKDSGLLASPNCPDVQIELLPSSMDYKTCSYHKIIHLNSNETYQVTSPYPQYKMVHKPWLIFDPITRWYYTKSNPSYIAPPSFLIDNSSPMEFIYPGKSSHIYVPIEITGDKGSTIFEVAHRGESVLYWHLDGEYIGMTQRFHQKLIRPTVGKHKMTVIDKDGNEIFRKFEILK